MRCDWLKTKLDRALAAIIPPVATGPIALAEALPWLVPKVQPRFAYEALGLRTGRPGPVFQPLAGSFAVGLVVDLPDQELDVEAADLLRWHADFDIFSSPIGRSPKHRHCLRP